MKKTLSLFQNDVCCIFHLACEVTLSHSFLDNYFFRDFLFNTRPLVKSVYQKIKFLISKPKHMLWVLKRIVSLRRFFCAPKI